MTHRIRLLVSGVALIAVTLLVSRQVWSQDKGQPPSQDPMAEMMAKWKELNTKGPEHKKFERMVGKWDLVMKMWMAPGGEPMVSKGTAEFHLILDGRYIVQKFKGESMGEAFEGMAVEGFDRIKKKFVSIWMDDSSTGIFMSEGTTDASGKVCTYYGKMDDPFTGQKDKVVKSIGREINDDKAIFEMYEKTPDGTEYKRMEITYTRRK